MSQFVYIINLYMNFTSLSLLILILPIMFSDMLN